MAKTFDAVDLTLLVARTTGRPVMTIEVSPFDSQNRISNNLDFLDDDAIEQLFEENRTTIIFDTIEEANQTFGMLANDNSIEPCVILAGAGETVRCLEYGEAIERNDYSAEFEPFITNPGISEEYLNTLARDLDTRKPENFTLTPIGAPGW